MKNLSINIRQFEKKLHWVKCDRIWSYSDPHFPAFGLNIERYLSLRIQSKSAKYYQENKKDFK